MLLSLAALSLGAIHIAPADVVGAIANALPGHVSAPSQEALILFSVVAVWPHPEGFMDFLFAAVLVWAVGELAVMPGEQGTNRYGPNPLRGAVTV